MRDRHARLEARIFPSLSPYQRKPELKGTQTRQAVLRAFVVSSSGNHLTTTCRKGASYLLSGFAYVLERSESWPIGSMEMELEAGSEGRTMGDAGVVHIAIDVKPTQLGDVLGELNRTGWETTGSEELNEERHIFPADAAARDVRWYRVYAERKLGNQPFYFGP
jgi:hypothetical protein